MTTPIIQRLPHPRGLGQTIYYSRQPSPVGDLILGSTASGGLCLLSFVTDLAIEDEVRRAYPEAELIYRVTPTHIETLAALSDPEHPLPDIEVWYSPLQYEVWCGMLTLERGELISYGELARRIGRAPAVRAVATAVGQNPISILIPCHRIIRSTGELGNYYWGTDVKRRVLDWERSLL